MFTERVFNDGTWERVVKETGVPWDEEGEIFKEGLVYSTESCRAKLSEGIQSWGLGLCYHCKRNFSVSSEGQSHIIGGQRVN